MAGDANGYTMQWINAQTSATTALDWTLLLLVVSELGTNIHRLMQRTRAPATNPGCSNTSASLSHNVTYYKSDAFSSLFRPSHGHTIAKMQSDLSSAQISRSQALAETTLARIDPSTMLVSTATVQELSTNDKVFRDQWTLGLYLCKESIPRHWW